MVVLQCNSLRSPPAVCVQAVSAASAIVEGTLDDALSKFLKKNIVKKELKDEVRLDTVDALPTSPHPLRA
jgi:hypothetical protein